MTVAALREIIDRIGTWPVERQERAAELLSELEAQDETWQLSDEDVEEVRRRLADTDAPTLTLEEFQQRMSRLGR
jgi:hypothetical protein